jgi:hypothetical protein
MKRFLGAFLVFFSLTGAQAFETAQPVTATPIETLPFTITVSGNYFLPANLIWHGTGAAITVEADSVTIDLNGRSLKGSGPAVTSPDAIAVKVVDQYAVAVQNGFIDHFGGFGVLLTSAPPARNHNQKNRVSAVDFNEDTVGVSIVNGLTNLVEHCSFVGGAIGILDVSSLGGDRFDWNSFANQKPVSGRNNSIGIETIGGKGVLAELNLVTNNEQGMVIGKLGGHVI